jgi:hypothetical protein
MAGYGRGGYGRGGYGVGLIRTVLMALAQAYLRITVGIASIVPKLSFGEMTRNKIHTGNVVIKPTITQGKAYIDAH